VLAAGASRRLPGPKQLLRYRGVTLVRRAAQTAVAAACGPVVVVLAPGAGPLRFELVDLDVRMVENPDTAKGLSTSVRAGLEALERGGTPDAVVFMTCDQPLLTAEILRSLVAAFAASRPAAVACEYAGTIGVPVLFDRSLFGELRALEGDQGAKRILRRHPAETVRIPFEQGSLDIDTPEDARRLGEEGLHAG
jgi:molybdenum cofactor cytidylyltransferase